MSAKSDALAGCNAWGNWVQPMVQGAAGWGGWGPRRRWRRARRWGSCLTERVRTCAGESSLNVAALRQGGLSYRAVEEDDVFDVPAADITVATEPELAGVGPVELPDETRRSHLGEHSGRVGHVTDPSGIETRPSRAVLPNLLDWIVNRVLVRRAVELEGVVVLEVPSAEANLIVDHHHILLLIHLAVLSARSGSFKLARFASLRAKFGRPVRSTIEAKLSNYVVILRKHSSRSFWHVLRSLGSISQSASPR